MLNSLSPNILGKICEYLNKAAILSLNQVSKATKEQLSTVASSRNTTLFALTISHLPRDFIRGKIRVSFYFKNEIDFIFWNFCFISSLIKLGFCHKESLRCTRKDRVMQELQLFLVHQKLEVFLQYLKPLFSRVQIQSMYTSSQSYYNKQLASAIIDMYANFLEGKSLENLSIANAETENFKSWINFLTMVRIKCAKIRMDFFVIGTIHFLLKLADLTRSMKIHLDCNHNPALLIPLLRGMTSRQCVKIDFKSYQTLTIAEIEQLLKVISYLNKKIHICAFTNSRIHNILPVGALVMKIDSVLEIKHLEYTEDH